MLLAIIADQRFHDGLFTGLNMTVTQLRQLLGVAFSSQDRIHNRQAGRPCQIADDMVNLQVYLVQRLLHMLAMKGGQLMRLSR